LEAKDYASFAESPFDNWLVRVRYADASELDGLLSDAGSISKWAKEEFAKLKK